MKVLYTSDTHVHPAHLNRLLTAAMQLRPDAVIIGGDLIPDWKGTIAASIESHRAWVHDKLLPRLHKFRAECPRTPVLLDLGNDDIAAARPLVEARDGEDLYLLHMRLIELDEGLAVVGYMNVNPTPFAIKDREKPDCGDRNGLSDPLVKRLGSRTWSGAELPVELNAADGTIEDDLEELSATMESARWSNRSLIFVSHAPPRDTALDRIGTGANVGSLAVKRFIEKWGSEGRLVASLHGHIHESPWQSGRAWQYVANVPCFNVGQQKNFLRALLMDTANVAESARAVVVEPSGLISVRGKDEWL
jgi:uncharacterized protein